MLYNSNKEFQRAGYNCGKSAKLVEIYDNGVMYMLHQKVLLFKNMSKIFRNTVFKVSTVD